MSALTLEALAARIQRLEDERAIQAHLVRYGLAADSDEVDTMASLYAEDTHVDIDARLVLDGREASRELVESPLHKALLPNCAHVMGPFIVDVSGDRAIATGYATVFLKEHGETKVWRQSFGRWELKRSDDGWEITQRVSRSTGRQDAATLFRMAL